MGATQCRAPRRLWQIPPGRTTEELQLPHPRRQAPSTGWSLQRSLPTGFQKNIPENKEGVAMTPENRAAYWKANLSLLTVLLVIWFVVSFGFGIILVDVLNAIQLGGFKLGFWFAQQGSIYTFLVLIFIYAVRMNQLDRKFEVHED
jgi:putative solute:sodium symporter small subunit